MAIHVDLGEIAMHMTNQDENCPVWLRGFESVSQVIEIYPKRLNMIDTVPSYESYNWMETFSEEQGTCSFGPPGRPSEKPQANQ